MGLRITLGWALLTFAAVPCPGAELFYMDHDPFTDKYVGAIGPLVLSGEIEPGDYDHLLAKILEDENRFLSQNKILLASDGGDVREAMKIGSLIKSLFSEVIVGTQTGRCVSACFLIYVSAQQRATEGDHLIGINRPYLADPPVTNSAAERDSLQQVRAFLHENDVPPNLIEEMFRHASDDAYWLTPDDEKALRHRARSFDQYLMTRCAWDPAIEREVAAGRRPIEDWQPMLKCRDHVTRGDAHAALLTASKEKSNRAH